jgi:hypothetical protein
MKSVLPIATFAERAQMARRTIERKIASGEIAPDYVQRRGRRVFIDTAALATLVPNLSQHDATQQRQAATPPDSQSELILALHESLRRERERADRAEARAATAEQERREVQRHLSEATKGIILLQRQLTPPVESPLPQPMTLSATPSPTRVDHTRRSTDVARAPSRRFSRWRFWVAH